MSTLKLLHLSTFNYAPVCLEMVENLVLDGMHAALIGFEMSSAPGECEITLVTGLCVETVGVFWTVLAS